MQLVTTGKFFGQRELHRFELMTSLAHVIRDFQSGALTHDAFVAQLDSTLTTEGLGSARLLEILGEAHTRMPLPPDVYAEVRRRIEQMPVSNLATAGEETRMQTVPEQLTKAPSPTNSGMSSGGSGLDQVKGTGDTLNNRFVLEECLGVGGMGTVYKALDLRKLEASDRKPYLAIKVLNTQFRGNPKSLIALQREARKAQVLAHRNIVTVYDFDRDGAIVYLTMEYLSGKALSQILRTADFKGMPVSSALPIVRGMSSALAYAHERGFVHCDFKPANVFLTDTGEVKVIDFGIARVFQRPEEESDATVFDPGSLGALTPAYASPEMLEHLEPDPRDDIYALGCITYELLTGRHPFDRMSATQARASNRVPQKPENLSTRQWRALRSALAFDRKSRTPTVSRFVEEFGAQERPSASKSAQRRPDRSRLLVKSGVAGLALACVAGGALYLYRSSQSQQESSALTETSASEAAAPEASTTSAAPVTRAPVPEAPRPAAPPPPTIAAVDAVFAQLPCSALAAAVHDRTVQVRGFVPQHDGVKKLKESLSTLPGVDSTSLDVQQIAGDKCDVVKQLAPYWTRNWQAGHVAGIRARVPHGQLTEGDSLVVDVTTPGYDSYVNIDYYVLDGSVVHMVPGPRAKDNQAPPHYSATIGGAGDWVISKPFGSELVVLLITPGPLFDTPRPESESRVDYLRALDARLKQLAGKYGQDHIVADIAQITSKARAH
jgi:serine/threonine protein kinase